MLIWNVLRGQLKYEVGMLSALYCLANLGDATRKQWGALGKFEAGQKCVHVQFSALLNFVHLLCNLLIYNNIIIS